ncbi:MAG: universal stress protein [Planctomycetes bacterium]|nr:universal stress protein [Planctomycetota bacterium]
MKRYERILVCIDRPERDVRMLEYAAGRSRLAETKDVYFLHVVDDAAAQPDETGIAPPRITPETLETLSREHFQGHGGETLHCEVVQGSPLIETLRFARDKDIDLILLGRHYGRLDDPNDEALLARRITRKATCSVLVLPTDYQAPADAIVVPVRDSECSAGALEVACGIAAATGASITALNVYHVNPGYLRVGTTLEEHQALLETAAHKECARLLERADTHDVNVACSCMPDLKGDPVPIILEAVETELKQFEDRIAERFLVLEREVLFLKVFAYCALALAVISMGFAFSR